jgi:ankyrin repeat protein
VLALLDHKCPLNLQNAKKETPLMLAAAAGRLSTVVQLISRGASTSLKDAVCRVL